jgi:rhamnosyltransferase subunit B
MARILIHTFGSAGDVNPYIGLALALQRRGHRPLLAMSSLFRESIEAAGLELHAVRPDIDLGDTGLLRRVMDPARGTETIFAELVLPNLRATFDDLSAVAGSVDLVVTHPAALVGPIVAAHRRLPWVSTVLAPMSFFSVSDPVVPPPAPWLYPWLARSPALSRGFVWLSDRVTRRWGRPVQRFRESLGLPAGANPILSGQHSPYGVLALFSRALASPQPDWPPHTLVTGPVLYNGAAPSSVPAALETFLAGGPPPLVFTLGTSAVESAGTFYEVSAEVARRLGQRAVLLIGRHPHNRPVAVGDDVLVLEYAPHDAVFARASVIVHQGGAGTLHQALRAGRPTLVVPHAHDQADNARRLASLGVSRTVYPRQYRVAAVEQALHALLHDTGAAQRSREVAAVVAAEPGAAAACDAIEAVLARGAGQGVL